MMIFEGHSVHGVLLPVVGPVPSMIHYTSVGMCGISSKPV